MKYNTSNNHKRSYHFQITEQMYRRKLYIHSYSDLKIMVDEELGIGDRRAIIKHTLAVGRPRHRHSSASIARTHAHRPRGHTTPGPLPHRHTTPSNTTTKNQPLPQTNIKPNNDAALHSRIPVHHLKFIHKNRYSTAPICLPFYASLLTLTLDFQHRHLPLTTMMRFTLVLALKSRLISRFCCQYGRL